MCVSPGQSRRDRSRGRRPCFSRWHGGRGGMIQCQSVVLPPSPSPAGPLPPHPPSAVALLRMQLWRRERRDQSHGIVTRSCSCSRLNGTCSPVPANLPSVAQKKNLVHVCSCVPLVRRRLTKEGCNPLANGASNFTVQRGLIHLSGDVVSHRSRNISWSIPHFTSKRERQNKTEREECPGSLCHCR